MGVRDRLEAARDEPAVVRITRGAFGADAELRYVVAIDADLVLLVRISDEIRLEGFVVLRIRDVTELEAPHAHSRFVEEALRRRGEAVARAPAIDLACLESAVRTAGRRFPIVAIHREELRTPDPIRIALRARPSD